MRESALERIKIVEGDITSLKIHAIVNAANNLLILGSGVAGAIKRKGGPSIQEECSRHGPVKIGEAALTGGGELPAKWVIHAASMGWGVPTTEESLRSSTIASLEIAREKLMEAVAFPALGTGVAGFPLKRCAELMIGEAVKFLEAHDYPREVWFCLWGEEARGVFEEVWKGDVGR